MLDNFLNKIKVVSTKPELKTLNYEITEFYQQSNSATAFKDTQKLKLEIFKKSEELDKQIKQSSINNLILLKSKGSRALNREIQIHNSTHSNILTPEDIKVNPDINTKYKYQQLNSFKEIYSKGGSLLDIEILQHNKDFNNNLDIKDFQHENLTLSIQRTQQLRAEGEVDYETIEYKNKRYSIYCDGSIAAVNEYNQPIFTYFDRDFYREIHKQNNSLEMLDEIKFGLLNNNPVGINIASYKLRLEKYNKFKKDVTTEYLQTLNPIPALKKERLYNMLYNLIEFQAKFSIPKLNLSQKIAEFKQPSPNDKIDNQYKILNKSRELNK